MARTVTLPRNNEALAWKWMRYSGLLLIPLAWGHVLIQDVLVGVDNIDLTYVSNRWAYLGWRLYDLFLLVFALAHGVNGMRQVVLDFVSKKKNVLRVNRGLFVFWFILVLLGIAALVGGVQQP